MSEKFTLEIISPDRQVIKIETSEVIIPAYEGEIGILKDHIPLITFLRPGLIQIKGESDKKYFVEDGTVEFANNNLLILTSTAKEIQEQIKFEQEKREISKGYTVAPAYNKGAYQVIPKTDVKHIGK